MTSLGDEARRHPHREAFSICTPLTRGSLVDHYTQCIFRTHSLDFSGGTRAKYPIDQFVSVLSVYSNANHPAITTVFVASTNILYPIAQRIIISYTSCIFFLSLYYCNCGTLLLLRLLIPLPVPHVYGFVRTELLDFIIIISTSLSLLLYILTFTDTWRIRIESRTVLF